MLELIFQGLIEWIYGLILEAWEHFASSLLDLMSMDFAYLEEHIPIIPTIRQAILAIGWALLLGNLVFQAAKSMLSGLGFEGEDPKLLFTRTFVFSFLLLASPQICDLCLNMTEKMIEVLRMPTAVHITLADESAFVGLSGAWLLVVICGIIVMFKSFKLIIEMAERYFILAMLTICAPLAFGTGGSRQTSDIFTGWCRMYGSMCLLMVLNVVFIKLLLSVLSYVPSGLDVLPWMVLVLTVVKVAKKADAIITRIGLNPAMTGDSLGRRSFPGMLTYMVARTMVSNAARSLGSGSGKNGSTGGSGSKKPNTPPGGSGAGGKSPHSGGNNPQKNSSRPGAANNRTSQGGAYSQRSTSHSDAQQNTYQQESQSQNSAAQYGGQQNSFADQQNTANHVVGNPAFSGGKNGTTAKQTRSTSVPGGAHRAPGHTKPPSGSAGGRNNSAAPMQAADRPADQGSKNPQAGIAGKNAVNPSATAVKSTAYPAPGTAGKSTGSTRRDNTTRETATASRSGMAGTERPAVSSAATVTGTQAPKLDHGTAGKSYEGGRAQNLQDTPRSGMAGNTHGDRVRTGISGKTASAQAFPNTTRGNGEKSRKTAASMQANTGLNGVAGTLDRVDSSRTGGATAPGYSSGNNEGAGGNNRQRTTEIVQSEISRSGTAGTAKTEVSDSGSGNRSTTRPIGAAGNTRPGTGGSLRQDAPGQPKTGKGAGAEAKGRGMPPTERNHPDGTADTRQSPVTSTIFAREQNHVSVNQHVTGASAAGDTVISPQQGSPKMEQPSIGNSRSTHRPPTEKTAQRPGTAAQSPRPADTLGGKQTQLAGHGTAGNATSTLKSADRNASVPGNKRPASPATSPHAGVQTPQTVRQESGGASAETHSSNRGQPAFGQNEAKTTVQSGPAATMRNGKAGKAALERPAVSNASTRQTAPVQSTRSSFVTASDRIGGKKNESRATGISQRLSGKANRSTKRKPRKTGGKKRGKQ